MTVLYPLCQGRTAGGGASPISTVFSRRFTVVILNIITDLFSNATATADAVGSTVAQSVGVDEERLRVPVASRKLVARWRSAVSA